jgi:hypothetical protein
MTNQPLYKTYLIRPENQSFVMGKTSLPAYLIFPRSILRIHKFIICVFFILIASTPSTIAIVLLNLADFADSLERANFFRFLAYVLFIASFINFVAAMREISISHLFQLAYQRWLAKRVLSKGGTIVEGLIHDVKYISVPEGADETIILFEIFIPDGSSIEGELCYIPGRRIQPFLGNTLKFLYLNNQCYFFL